MRLRDVDIGTILYVSVEVGTPDMVTESGETLHGVPAKFTILRNEQVVEGTKRKMKKEKEKMSV